ncbi:MAG: methyltransferase [Bryobacteraceae bacterium]|nr:methyltransferase [Bryobacteraceae bacterium]
MREAAVLVRNDTPQNPQLVAYVAPHLDTTAVETEQISYWQGVNTQIFGNQPAPADLTFNITGWSSSYTGLPFADDEMREWVEATVATIRALQPNHVLEIGCGTGLLVSRIAPHCQRYVGADFSPEVLRNIEQLRASDPALAHVELQQRTADNFAGIEPHAFDVVILNSVIQYFPSIDYLRRVLQAAVNAGKPGGKIFLGDVRSLPLLAAQQAMIQLVSAGNEITRTQLEQRVQRALQDEEELVIDPMFFLALQRTLPQISDVEIQLKRGVHVNELMQFRYTAILHIGDNDQGDHHPVAGRNGHVSQAPASKPSARPAAATPGSISPYRYTTSHAEQASAAAAMRLPARALRTLRNCATPISRTAIMARSTTWSFVSIVIVNVQRRSVSRPPRFPPRPGARACETGAAYGL